MSTPLYQQPPPMGAVTQQAYSANTGHGSVGPVIAVLAVITILGVIAGMIGRLCSGRRIMNHGEYDFEGWVERKCSSCLDGNVYPPPPRSVAAASRSGGEDVPVAVAVTVPVESTQQEIKEEKNEKDSHASSSQS